MAAPASFGQFATALTRDGMKYALFRPEGQREFSFCCVLCARSSLLIHEPLQQEEAPPTMALALFLSL